MSTKLTLHVDGQLVERAKRHAERSGKSLSQIVANYFALIESDVDIPGTEITPRVRALIGSLRGATVTEGDYRQHLEEKRP